MTGFQKIQKRIRTKKKKRKNTQPINGKRKQARIKTNNKKQKETKTK